MTTSAQTQVPAQSWAAASKAYLDAELQRLRLLLRRRVLWLRHQWQHDSLQNCQGWVISEAQADWLLTGQVESLGDGFVLIVQLHNVVYAELREQARFSLPDPTSEHFRMAVHRVSDQVVEWIFDEPGMAASRIVFSRVLQDGSQEIYMVDSDGDINELIPLSIESGVNGMWPLEVQAGVDAVAIRKEFGKQCILWGNIDKRALARGKEVIVSRGHLVEIGGGFRMPAVMRQSGARLVEVGTTNRTYIQDYEEAITEETALLMSVHRSNFRLTGFVHEPALGQLVELGERTGLPVVDDLGSGALLDTSAYGLAHEPTLQESVAQGVALVSASGDKLLGGPQAGIIVGRGDAIAKLKRHPLTRALRVDKTTIAGLQATLLHYLKGEAEEKVPIWRMIAMPIEAIEGKAMDWTEKLVEAGIAARVVDGRSTVGGGSLPGETLPTKLVAIQVDSPAELARRLRASDPPVIGRIENDLFLLDPRTVLAEEDEVLLEIVRRSSL